MGKADGSVDEKNGLEDTVETKDVSFAKDMTMMKKAIREGEGYDTPKDTAKVKLSVESATDGIASLPGFTAKVLEFTAGNGEVCDALECAVAEMKKGERAVLTVTVAAQATEVQLGLADLTSTVVFTLELQEFEAPKSTWNLGEQEKLDYAAARKDVAGGLFKSGRTQLALERYKKIVELLNHIDNFKDTDLKTKAKDVKRVCELNKAACYLRLKEHAEAKKACDEVLKEESQNVKALYRRAQAECGLKNFQECIWDCKRVIEIDSQNKDARALLRQAQVGQKEEDKKSKGLFANMCKALGKGPIPEPGKSQAPVGSEEDEAMSPALDEEAGKENVSKSTEGDGDDPMLPALVEEAGKENVPKSTEGDGDDPMLPAREEEAGKKDMPQSTEADKDEGEATKRPRIS